MAIPRIDAHQHFWQYSPLQYGWISDRMPSLKRDFLPKDLAPLLAGSGLSGAIAVQARETMEETHWLLELANEHTSIVGVVGWAPLASPNFSDSLESLRDQQKLSGLRHNVQTEPDPLFLRGEAFNDGIRQLRETGLVYDLLIHSGQLGETIRFVDQHPQQQFVLDHCAKPPLIPGEEAAARLAVWHMQIRELAKRQHVACKVSGLVTEADWARWDEAQLRPCWEAVLEAFTPARLLFGSDWPVETLASSYQRWVGVVAGWASELTESEQQALWGENAARVYRLG